MRKRKQPHRAWVCAQEGNADELERLLQANLHPDTAWKGRTLLWIAALNDHVACVDVVARAGGNVDKASPSTKTTPLHCAAASGHVASVETLLRASVNVHSRCRGGCTALLLAARRGHARVVTQLAAAKADINAPTGECTTPLYHAAAEASVACVQELLELGADAVMEYDTVSPLRAACNRRDVGTDKVLEMATLLLNAKASPNRADGWESSALHDAARLGLPDLIGLLTGAGADLHFRHEGGAPMSTAIECNQLGAVVALLQNKADAGANVAFVLGDTSSQRPREISALHQAALHGHVRIVDALLAAKASVGRDTILTTALRHGRAAVVHTLLAHKADASAALRASVKHGRADCVELLLDSVAGPGAYMLTALQAAVTHRAGLGCVNALLQHKNTGLLGAAAADDLSVLLWRVSAPCVALALLNHKASVEARDERRQTPLHVAAHRGCTGVARALLDHKADVLALDRKQRSPLHAAARSRNFSVAKLLLARGAHPGAVDFKGLTPLHLARSALVPLLAVGRAVPHKQAAFERKLILGRVHALYDVLVARENSPGAGTTGAEAGIAMQ